MRALCIGGPMDGRIFTHEDDLWNFRVAEPKYDLTAIVGGITGGAPAFYMVRQFRLGGRAYKIAITDAYTVAAMAGSAEFVDRVIDRLVDVAGAVDRMDRPT